MFELIKKYTKGYVFISFLGPFFKLLEALIELFIPLLVAAIIDKGINNADSSLIWRYGLLILALYIVGFIFSSICQYFAAKSSFGFGTNLRRDLYRHINSLPLADIDALGTSTMVTRINHDVTNTQNMLNRLIRLVTRAPFLLIGALIMAVYISPKLSLIFFAAAFLLSLALFLVMRLSSPRLRQITLSHDEVTLLTRENLSGARVVRAFGKQDEEEADFDKATKKLRRQSVLLGLVSALSSPLTYLIVNASIILVIYFGAGFVESGELSQGRIIALTNYLMQILNAMVVLALLVTLFAKAAVSSKRIKGVLALPSEDESGLDLATAESGGDEVLRFCDVSMAYGKNAGNSLKNISFSLAKGQTLGVIGSTGSGKTTLVSLVPKLYEYEGEIFLSGTDLKNLSAKSVREAVSVVPQKSVLFAGTVRENLLISCPSATDEQLLEALKRAQCGFVTSLDAVVSRGGSNFSGGQRQRLCIARGLLKNARVLIFDDSMSALDYSTEAEIKREINKLTDVCKIIVTQRASVIKNADLILVLEGGHAVGVGKHAQLLKSCEIYKEINEIQGATL